MVNNSFNLIGRVEMPLSLSYQMQDGPKPGIKHARADLIQMRKLLSSQRFDLNGFMFIRLVLRSHR